MQNALSCVQQFSVYRSAVHVLLPKILSLASFKVLVSKNWARLTVLNKCQLLGHDAEQWFQEIKLSAVNGLVGSLPVLKLEESNQ